MATSVDDDHSSASDNNQEVEPEPTHISLFGALKDTDKRTAVPFCIARIQRELMANFREPTPGLFMVPDNDDITMIHAVLVGPEHTPYHGGFFYFVIRCPPNYPIEPPRVTLMTTAGGTVRFNPNLYKNGKVCLSILGTWSGPQWCPALTLNTVLVSIQSLMNETPYHNEPGYEKEFREGDAERYNEIILHETLRVAVCDMMEKKCPCPVALYAEMEQLFPKYYDHYVSVCKQNRHITGQMKDPFGTRRGKFNYTAILHRLKAINRSLRSNSGRNVDDDDGDDEEEVMEEDRVSDERAESFRGWMCCL